MIFPSHAEYYSLFFTFSEIVSTYSYGMNFRSPIHQEILSIVLIRIYKELKLKNSFPYKTTPLAKKWSNGSYNCGILILVICDYSIFLQDGKHIAVK